MNDPKRWLDEQSEADDQERALLLLGTGAELDPPSAAEDATWQALLRQIGPGTPGSDAPPDPPPAPPVEGGSFGASALPKTPLLASPISKVVASLSLVGALSGGLIARGPHEQAPLAVPSAQPGQPAPRLQASTIPARIASVEAPPLPPPPARVDLSPEPARRQAPPALAQTNGTSIQFAATPPVTPDAPAAPLDPPPPQETERPPGVGQGIAAAEGSSERMQRLLGENQLVSQARAELQGGSAGAALRTLAALDAQYPRGVLRQEREVLTIEALAATGQRAAAGQRADIFLRSFPRSPHAARLQTFVQPAR